MRNIFNEPLFINLKEKLLGTPERPTALAEFPEAFQETRQQMSWLPQSLREPTKKVREFITPQSPEQAQQIGMLSVGTKEEPLFIDVMGAIAPLKKVSGKIAPKIIQETKPIFQGITKSTESVFSRIKKIPDEVYHYTDNLSTEYGDFEEILASKEISSIYQESHTGEPLGDLISLTTNKSKKMRDLFGSIRFVINRNKIPDIISKDEFITESGYRTRSANWEKELLTQQPITMQQVKRVDIFVDDLIEKGKDLFDKGKLNYMIENWTGVQKTPQEIKQQILEFAQKVRDSLGVPVNLIGSPETLRSIPLETPKIFKGFKDLTTKVLEKLKGRTTVSKQFISDLTNMPELKQSERDVIRNVLDSYGGKNEVKIPKFNLTKNKEFNSYVKNVYNEFKQDYLDIVEQAKKIVPEAQIQDVQLSGNYGRGLPNEKSDIDLKFFYSGNISENVLRSKLENKFGLGGGGTDIHLEKITPDQIPVQEFAEKVKSELLPLKVKISKTGQERGYQPRWEEIVLKENRGDVINYAEHIYESPIETGAGQQHYPGRTANYFGHTRIEEMAPNYMPGKKVERTIEVQSDLYQKGGLERELPSERWIEKGRQAGVSEKTLIEKQKSIQKLQQYNDPTAHFRMIREDIKSAAQRGMNVKLYPTGETIMKIEGLGEMNRFWEVGPREGISNIQLTSESLKIGKTVRSQMGTWVITDILGDGKFKAVPKSVLKEFGAGGVEIKRTLKQAIEDGAEETFDISGKIDTSNPIYRFYEKDIGRYLTNKYNAKQIIDNKGVKWWEVDIKPEFGKMPVEAFGIGALPMFQEQREEEKPRIFKSQVR